MDTNQLLISLIVVACPMSLVIGALAALFALRVMGIRWPWEQVQQGRMRYDRKSIRVGAKHIVSAVLREKEKGWVYTGQTEDGPGIWDAHFIRGVRWQQNERL